jgi:glycosyltransferase involved in cell wall biosynthesis
VLLDATAIPENLGGVGRYLENLVPELDRRVNLSIVAQHHAVGFWQVLAPSAQVVAAPRAVAHPAVRLLWEQVSLPRLARRLDCDVLHSPHYTMPLHARMPVVVTLHDATFFSDPDLHSQLKMRFFRASTRRALRCAAEIVVPSAATRTELERLVSPAAARCRVVHHGVDDRVFHPPTPEEVAAARLLVGADSWIAFLGTIEPRKNVPALIRGFLMALERAVAGRVAPGGSTAPVLVLAGAPGWDADAAALADDAGDHVRTLGYVDSDVLPGLLGGATVVVYPSLGEGFGLPVLEGMACGAAVLTTRRLALPEVGGDAVAYTEPEAAAIADALAALIDDPARRADLGRRALARSTEFGWDSAADGHVAAYSAAAAGATA